MDLQSCQLDKLDLVIPREKKILVPADWPLELGGFVNVIGKLTLGVR